MTGADEEAVERPTAEDAGDIAAPGGLVARVFAARRHLTRRTPAQQRALLVVAGLVFVAAAAVALRNLPDDLDPHWLGLVLVGTAGPLLTVALNGAEFVVQGSLLGRRTPFAEAVRISVLATAANLLPLPGSAIVRTQALSGEGYRRAAGSTIVVAVAWLGCTAGVAAVLYGAVGDAWAVTGALAAVAAGAIGGTWVFVRRAAPPAGTAPVFVRLLAVETATALVGAARFYLTIRVLGFDVTPGQAVALTLAGVVASATGIFPAGIGIREALAGAVSPLVGLSASVGVVAAAVDRVAGLVVLAVLTGILAVRGATVVSTRESGT